MDEILEILEKDARVTPQEIAKMTGKSAEAVKKTIKKYEQSGTIVKYRTIINRDVVNEGQPIVRALIEVGITPQRSVGFDSIAERIYSFPEVVNCYLVSGSYDLLVVVEGDNIQTVANFVASKLASLDHVRSTVTHFLLKKYKEDGHILTKKKDGGRLKISY